ncbi:hypothetical protein GQ457_10G014100 [Hibiscus cannabinus]
MEVKGRRETTRISNWHEGMEVHFQYFSWFDPPMTPRARVVMVGLLKRIKANDVQRRNERGCKIICDGMCYEIG